MSDSVIFQSASALSRLLEAGQLSSKSLCEELIRHVDQTDSEVGSFLGYESESILSQAVAADARREAGESRGPLDGIPVALKNLIAVRDEPLTCASRMLENFVSPYDAHVVENLRKAGAILFGRLNMDEFAMGSSTENSALQTTRNPWSSDHIPGGSSGGSATVVAAGQSPLSLGSDTGGSIRQPASYCGVVGLKPTYGRVSRYGLVAFASSLDQIGPLGRTVEDVAMLLDVISGHDERDSTSIARQSGGFAAAVKNRSDSPAPVVGIPREYFGDGLEHEVRARLEEVIEEYRSQGASIREVSLPLTEYAVPVYYILATAEASSNLSRYDGVRYGHRSEKAKDAVDLFFQSRGEGFGAEVKRRIMLGTYVLSSGYYDAWYLRAQKVRTRIRDDFLRVFNEVDVLLTPTTPTPAFRFGEKTGDPLQMYLSDIYTISANLAGIPAISVPCGLASNGLPLGFQLMGKPFGEAELLQVAAGYEESHPAPVPTLS